MPQTNDALKEQKLYHIYAFGPIGRIPRQTQTAQGDALG
jgi:hypothetical protein